MEFKSAYTGKVITLESCPFCGSDDIEFGHIGNEHTKIRKIEVRCKSCRIQRRDATFTGGFEWLEDVAMKNWNQRPVTQ